MREWHVKLGPDGQLTLPDLAIDQLGLHPEDTVVIAVVNDELRLRPSRSRLLRGFGAVTPTARPEQFDEIRDTVEQLIAEEVAREL